MGVEHFADFGAYRTHGSGAVRDQSDCDVRPVTRRCPFSPDNDNRIVIAEVASSKDDQEHAIVRTGAAGWHKCRHAEVLRAQSVVASGAAVVVGIQVVSAGRIPQFGVADLVGKHMVNRHQDLVGYRHSCSLVSAPSFETVKFVPQVRPLSFRCRVGRLHQNGLQIDIALGMRLFSRLAADSLFPGQTPAHDVSAVVGVVSAKSSAALRFGRPKLHSRPPSKDTFRWVIQAAVVAFHAGEAEVLKTQHRVPGQ